jgi:hypothetical protein
MAALTTLLFGGVATYHLDPAAAGFGFGACQIRGGC